MTRTVLVIDDAPEVLALAQIFLKATGLWRVLTAPNGEAGLAIAAQEKPDVVLIDVRMPGLDGISTLRLLRSQSPGWSPAAAFVTASPEDLGPDLLESLRVPVISKPFRAATFGPQVAALLSQLVPS